MTKTISRTAIVLAAGIAASLALFFALGSDSSAQGTPDHGQSASHSRKHISQAELALRQDMRKLWEDHITWTRLAIVSFDADLPDLQATEGRLLQNQADIGDAIATFYGRPAGDELTGLLRSHILIAVDVLAAAKAGDQEALAEALRRWDANGRDIAHFLTAANPRNWPASMTEEMMHRHLALTTDEAVAHLQGRFEDDVAAYDAVHAEILEMADMLSDGIVAQFPNRFH